MSMISELVAEIRQIVKNQKDQHSKISKVLRDAADAIETLAAKNRALFKQHLEENEMLEKACFDGGWIRVNDMLPPDNRYVLISTENYTLADIGRYEKDEDGGGAFYPGDEDFTYVSIGLFVNAWMPLPKPYRESEDE